MNEYSSKSKLSEKNSNSNDCGSSKFSTKSKSKYLSNQSKKSKKLNKIYVSDFDEKSKMEPNFVNNVRINDLKKDQRQDLSKSKRAKYASASMSAHRVLKDLKNTATRHLSNVKYSFDNLLSKKLRLRSPKEGNEKSAHDSGSVYYNEFENEPRTPVKLYIPFGIETPNSAKIDSNKIFRKYRKVRSIKNTCRQMIFSSPTGKIKDDVKSITNSLNELSLMTADIKYKFAIQNLSNDTNIMIP